MYWFIFNVVCLIVVLVYAVTKIISVIMEREYQKLWDKEKDVRLRCKPNISKAELCEYYVMFCKRNDCKVEF